MKWLYTAQPANSSLWKFLRSQTDSEKNIIYTLDTQLR